MTDIKQPRRFKLICSGARLENGKVTAEIYSIQLPVEAKKPSLTCRSLAEALTRFIDYYTIRESTSQESADLLHAFEAFEREQTAHP